MEKEENGSIRYRLKVESRVERGVVQELGKVLTAQEQLGMELLKTRGFLVRTYHF